jgi:SAM-dependent methyltransferase
MLQYIKQRVRQYIDYTIDKKIDEKFPIYQQIYEFRNAPDDMLSSKVEAKTIISNLAERLEAIVTVTKTIIDISEFEVWLKEYPEVVSYYDKLGDVKIEKLLEHYLTSKHLDAGRGVYIDIAASGSPFSDAVGQHTGCKAYCQDLVFEKGIHGNRIGGDAGEMPVPDDFADVMALHCAFECFQGDADIRFVKEAGRVLKNGGRFGIIPLYLDDIYFVKTGPK